MGRARQQVMGFPRRGGRRPGAGRKPKGRVAGVKHARREALASRHPVHVTLRVGTCLPRLRGKHAYRELRQAFSAGKERFGFRLCHYSVQQNHLHLIVEAKDRQALSRGMRGLAIRVAKALNRLWRRSGKVFPDRYHARILRTPTEVRNALAYVLNNARRHGRALQHAIDLFASGLWFDGWKERGLVRGTLKAMGVDRTPPRPTARATSWLLTKGWRKRGLIHVAEVPGAG